MTLSARGQALIDAAKSASPTDSDRARVRRALALRLGAAGVASYAGGRALPSFFGAKAPFLASLALSLGLGAAGGAAWQGAREQPLSAHMLALPPLLIAVTVPEPGAPAPPTPQPATSAPLAVRSAPPRPRAPASAPVALTEAPLRDELTLLESAYRALGQGQTQDALARVAELESRHPEGALVEERLAVRALALCAEGRVAEAREARRALVALAPASIQLGRLQASCAGETAP
jgi:hypothetical protein